MKIAIIQMTYMKVSWDHIVELMLLRLRLS